MIMPRIEAMLVSAEEEFNEGNIDDKKTILDDMKNACWLINTTRERLTEELINLTMKGASNE